jgi:hypothetical protein
VNRVEAYHFTDPRLQLAAIKFRDQHFVLEGIDFQRGSIIGNSQQLTGNFRDQTTDPP